MTKPTANPFLFWLFSFLLLGYVVVFCYASLFSHPIADDFSYASISTKEGVFTTAYQEYFRWGGRYSSNIVWLINPIKHSLLAYQLAGIATIVILFFSLWVFISALFRGVSRSRVMLSNLVVLVLFLYNMPNTAEGIYWYTGAVAYTVASALALLFFGLLIYFLRGKYILHKHVHLLVLCVWVFVVMGFNEVLSIIVVGLLFGIFLEGFTQNNYHKGAVSILFFVALGGLALLLLSPGSANRASVFTNNKDVLHSFIMASVQVLRFVTEWISVPLLLASVAYISVHRTLSEHSILFLKSFYISRWISLAMLFAVVFVSVFLPYYATGILGQHRTVNVAYLFFLLLWFLNLSVWINHYQLRAPQFSALQKWALIGVFLLSVTFTKNSYGLLTDIAYGKLKSYHTQMTERYSIIKQHQQNPNIPLEFTAIEYPPKTIFVLDIDTDSTHWLNEGYRLFYKTEEHVKLKNTP